MKRHQAARRRKRPHRTPPPSPPPTWFDRIAPYVLSFGLLLLGYDQACRYAITHYAVLTYMYRHHIPFPHIWLMKQFERLPFPGREAVAQSGNQPNERIYSIHNGHLGEPLLPTEWLTKQLGLLHVPISEAVAQSGNQSPERIIYLHTDHLERVIATTDQQGNLVHASLPDSFGKPQSGEPGPTNLGFPGQYYDKETGLYYNNRRDYDPFRGRYMQPDPIGLAGGINPYLYAANNPLSYIDPSGLYCVYQQINGRMICYPFSPARPPESRNASEAPGTPRDGLRPYYDEFGYAGTGAARNNPDMQGVKYVGPIPRGAWMYTGTPYWSRWTGKNTMQLAPLSGNECSPPRDCDTFRIHGNNARNDASEGCIVLPPNRITIPSNEVIYVQ